MHRKPTLKKCISFLLAALMIVQCGYFVMPAAFAAEGETTETGTVSCEICNSEPCTCETSTEDCDCDLTDGVHAADCPNYVCPDCGTAGWHETCPETEGEETTVCEVCGADPCTCEQEEAGCPYCDYTLAEDGTLIHSEICYAEYAYDGEADVGKYVQLIPEVAVEGVSVSDDPLTDDGIWFYYDEFGEGTVMKIIGWYWDPDTTGLWYCVELYKGAFPEGDEEYQWPDTPWILHDYTDYTYEYAAALEFVTVTNPCGCCDSCTGDETCTCECEGCTCKGEAPEIPSIDTAVTDEEGNLITDGEGNPITITVTGEALPEEAEVTVVIPSVNGELLSGVYDIKVYDKDGNEWQPGEGETVTLSIPVDTSKECVGVLHYIDYAAAIDGDEEIISLEYADEAALAILQPALDAYGDGIHVAVETISVIRVENGMAVFETDSFSIYTPDYTYQGDSFTVSFTSSVENSDPANEKTYYATVGQSILFTFTYDGGLFGNIDQNGEYYLTRLSDNLSLDIGSTTENKVWDGLSCTITESITITFSTALGIEIEPGDRFELTWKSNKSISPKNPRWTRVMIVGEFDTTFDANGGAFSDSSTTLSTKIVSYQPVSMIEEPTRPGYVFTGWGTTQDGTGGGTVYTSADSFPASLPTDTVFYAQWEPMQYTVTYVVPDGVSNADLFTEQIKYHDAALTLHTDTPADMGEGAYFLYWIGSDGNQYQPGDSYATNEDLILVSEWSPAVYSVVYDANGGTDAPDSQYAYQTQGYAVTLTTKVPQRAGYSFTGWNTDPNGNGTAYTGGTEYTLANSVILYAQWSAITYTIQFNGYGSTGGDMSDNAMGGLLYDTSYANLIANEYTKTDYTFQGWSLTEGGVVQYANGENVKVSDLVDAAVKAGQTGDIITLYAVWAKSTYKIIYQAANSDSGVSITNLSQTVIYAMTEQTTINSSASRNRYTFAGWSDGTTVYQNGETVPVPSPEEDGATITLTATWKMNIVGYICTMVDGSPVMMGTVSADGYTDPGNPVSHVTIQAEENAVIPDMVFTPAEGYEITKIVIEETEYTDVSSMLNADGTYTYDSFTATAPHFVAVITSLKSYTVTFKDDDDSVLSTQTVQYGAAVTAPADPTKTGYTFQGWVDEDGNAATVPSTMPAENLVFYAKWESLTYTVTWSSGIGTFPDGTTTKNITLNYGDTPVWTGENPTYETADNGYTWVGWDPAITMVTGDITYTAVYTQWSIITWVNWDGSVLETDEKVVTGTKPEYNGATPTREATAQYSYTFSGWSPSVEEATKHVTYTAQYTETVNTYTVTFVDYDGTTVLKTEKVPYGSAATAPADPTRADYTFTGWDKAFNNVTGDLTVTAQYEKNDVISVTIEWGSLTFVYTKGEWQPDSHTYADGTITPDPESDTANLITVTNNNESTVAVDVTIAYAQAANYTDIRGSFDKTAATAAIGASVEFRLSLSLSGNLTDPPSSFTSGTVTVSIEKAAGGG